MHRKAPQGERRTFWRLSVEVTDDNCVYAGMTFWNSYICHEMELFGIWLQRVTFKYLNGSTVVNVFEYFICARSSFFPQLRSHEILTFGLAAVATLQFRYKELRKVTKFLLKLVKKYISIVLNMHGNVFRGKITGSRLFMALPPRWVRLLT